MVKKCINRALVSAQLNMNFLFAVTLNFAVNIPNDSYFIILGNRTSAKLYHDSGYIELLLLENECYEQFHIPVGDKITFSYNWMNKSVDGIRLRRYAGNCNITSFDYNSIKYNETCTGGALYNQKSGYNLEYFICFLIPLLLLMRSDTIYNVIRRLHNHLNSEIEQVFESVAEDINITHVI